MPQVSSIVVMRRILKKSSGGSKGLYRPGMGAPPVIIGLVKQLFSFGLSLKLTMPECEDLVHGVKYDGMLQHAVVVELA